MCKAIFHLQFFSVAPLMYKFLQKSIFYSSGTVMEEVLSLHFLPVGSTLK